MQVIGHRGAAALAPENTWASFDRALALGVDAIETDVQATSDGQLVLMHDERLDRTTNGSGPVQQTLWSVVRELDAGSWFSEEYRGVRVPLLVPTLERYSRRMPFALEVKQRGIELRVVDHVLELGILERITFTSFDWEVVRRIKAEHPSARVGFLTSDVSPESVQRVVAAGLDQFCPPADRVSEAQVSAWKALGLEVRAWGVRDPEVMMSALRAGVDGMTVDFPHLLLQALGRTQK
jgi:glycerophosphoryl diester phosphodiesterase